MYVLCRLWNDFFIYYYYFIYFYVKLDANINWVNHSVTELNCVHRMSQDAEVATQTSGKRKLDAVLSSYHKKYEHLLGKEAAKDAARATDANKSYGFGNCLQHFVIVDVL